MAKKVKKIAKKKPKTVSAKKSKGSTKSKTKKVAPKKAGPVSKKAKVKVSAKKNKKAVTKKAVTKKVTAKNTRTLAKKTMPAKVLAKSIAKPKSKKLVKKLVPIAVKSTIEIHGEDMHFIPHTNENIGLTPLHIQDAENKFHQKEEVAFHQENQKVKAAMPSRKIFKRFNRNR